MPRPRKRPPRSREETLLLDFMQTYPVEEWPEEIKAGLVAVRDRVIEMAERGDKHAKEIIDMLAQRYKGASDPMIAYLASKATERRGPRPKLSDEELRNAWARCRRKNHKATASDLAKMLAREGLGGFSSDYLRRRIQRLP
jgi:hypothetical protein